MDTIAAIATAPGPAGVSIVRISGDDAFCVAAKCVVSSEFGVRSSESQDRSEIGDRSSEYSEISMSVNDGQKNNSELLPPNSELGGKRNSLSATYARFRNPKSGEIIDDGIVLCFKAPHSYTGENVVELQGHGGRLPSSRLLRAALAAGARMAEPGEFTRRAFLNGKLDLAKAEAVMDLIGASSERAASSAAEQLSGRLSSGINFLFDEMISLLADVEHLLDFDEGEIPNTFALEATHRTRAIKDKLAAYISTWRIGTYLREGALLVLCGKPNAGKSSLLNALLGRERAIVSPVAGTTRDTIEETLIVQGIPVRIVDTAGLRETDDGIEAEGTRRAEELIAKADIIVEVVSIEDGERTINPSSVASPLIVAYNKCDLDESTEYGVRSSESQDRSEIGVRSSELFFCPSLTDVEISDNSELRAPNSELNKDSELENTVFISAKTGDGIDNLLTLIAKLLDDTPQEEALQSVSERHRGCLEGACHAIVAAEEALCLGDEGLVIAAEKLSVASEAVGTITGRVWNEELLDTVFGKFCVGK